MSTGVILGYWLIGLIIQLIIWGIIDAVVFIRGDETLSQYVIEKKEKEKKFKRWMQFSILTFIGILIWLFYHWELHA